jgi:hypothetical protein
MAPPKSTYKTEQEAKAKDNTFIKQYFKSTKKGRPKKADGDTPLVTRKKKPGPVAHLKKPPPKPAPSEGKKRASEEAPDGAPDGVYFKVKKKRTNWGEGTAKVKLDAAIKE